MSEAYTGTDVLENLADLANYNGYLASLVTQNVKPGTPLVDFGAGLGTFAEKFRDAGHAVACVEPDEGMLQRLRANGFQTEAALTAFPDSSLQAVYTFNVLEHIEDDNAYIAEVYRKLRPGGLFIVYVPANSFLWTSLDDKVKHFRRYSRGEMKRKLAGAGFTLRTLHYADALGVPAALAYKLFGPKDGTIDPGKARFYDRCVFPISRKLDLVCRHLTGKNVVAIAIK